MLGVGYTQYICNFQQPYPTTAWHTTYTTSISQQCTQTVSSCAKLFSHYQIQQYIHSSTQYIHTITTLRNHRRPPKCGTGASSAQGSLKQVQLTSILGNKFASWQFHLYQMSASLEFTFFSYNNKKILIPRESCRSSATYDFWLKAES